MIHAANSIKRSAINKKLSFFRLQIPKPNMIQTFFWVRKQFQKKGQV